jgi:hypothetical protein
LQSQSLTSLPTTPAYTVQTEFSYAPNSRSYDSIFEFSFL